MEEIFGVQKYDERGRKKDENVRGDDENVEETAGGGS